MEENKVNEELKDNKKLNTKKLKTKKKDKLKTWAIVTGVILSIFVICVIVAGLFINFLLDGKPDLDLSVFNSAQSSIIYDAEGNVIAEVGATIRQNATYDEFPQDLVNAFVAVEDSRYFEHKGFDLPRFTKALLDVVKTHSFSQGGSTFTMQLVKNTYFVDDETGTSAASSGLAGLKRKAQEIALAMELDANYSKEKIFELYLNKLNFGGSNNSRGIAKAANYYFGVDVEDLTLTQCAFLAGVINAPSAYNPYYHLEAATERRNEVLYLMKYHGYITEDEYQMALNVKLEDELYQNDVSTTVTVNGETKPYQAYIDTVIDEVISLTGLDPTYNSMKIYTAMVPEVQDVMDAATNGTIDTFEYPNEWLEVGSVCIRNSTGELIGICGGRNYTSGGSLLFNHATDIRKQPGSSVKAFLDYALAFENLGWSTAHVVTDEPIYYPWSDIVVKNSYGGYFGQIRLTYALAQSRNIPAISALYDVYKKMGSEYIINYLETLGFDIDEDDFDFQYAIGGKNFTVSPVQMAGARAMILNGGVYNTPHTVNKIEFTDGTEPIDTSTVYKSTQVLSSGAAYLTSRLLYANVYDEGGYHMTGFRADYEAFAKTGTTDWGTSGRVYGIPYGSAKDSWLIASTSEYTVATWEGYDEGTSEHISYLTDYDLSAEYHAKIDKAVINATVDKFGKPADVVRPDDIVEFSHTIAVYPYVAPVDGYGVTGLIKKEFATYATHTTPTVNDIGTGSTATTSGTTLTLTWPKYTNEEQLQEVGGSKVYNLTDGNGNVVASATGAVMFDWSWVEGHVQYKADIYVDGTLLTTVASDSETTTYTLPESAMGKEVTVNFYYGYSKADSKSSNVSTVKVTTEPITATISLPTTGTTLEKAKSLVDYWLVQYPGLNASVVDKTTTKSTEQDKIEITIDGKAYSNSSYTFDLTKASSINIVVTHYTYSNSSSNTNNQSTSGSTTGQ